MTIASRPHIPFLWWFFLRLGSTSSCGEKDTKGPLTGKKSVGLSHAVSRESTKILCSLQNDQTSEACPKVLRDLNFVHMRAAFLYFRGKLHVTGQQSYNFEEHYIEE